MILAANMLLVCLQYTILLCIYTLIFGLVILCTVKFLIIIIIIILHQTFEA